MELPLYIPIVFVLTTLLTIYLYYKASGSGPALLVLLLWFIIQGFVSYSGFYTVTNTLPPRFMLLVLPPLLLIILLFLTKKGRMFIDRHPAGTLTWLHTVRIPVELVLLWLFQEGKVPELMTFEGRNFDILAGITAPFIAYFGFRKKKLGKPVLLAWNILCLGLLFNIVIHAILSAPTPFQKLAFEQPNLAVFYFPYSWLPCCIVPLVLFSHLATIRQLARKT